MLRSALAFVLPSLLGISALALVRPFGAVAARNAAMWLIVRSALPLAGIRLAIHGQQQLLHQRPAVFVINHQSGLDPLLVAAALGCDVQAVAKKELRHHPLLGPLLWLAGSVFVDPHQHRGGAQLAPALTGLANGQAVALAAEGHRSIDQQLLPFKPGCLWLAQRAKLPIIPLVLHNSRQRLPAGALRISPGTVDISVLPAQDAKTLSLSELEQLFRDALQQVPT